MSQVDMQVHDGASVDPTAEIDEGAVIERGAVVGPHCRIGPGTRVRTGAIIVEHTEIGAENDVHPNAVIGGDPQDRKFDPAEDFGRLIIGDRNVFREGVTINRGAGPAGPTKIGSGCYFMASSHVGHNAQVSDDCVLTNCAAIAGHASIGVGCVLSSFVSVHQFCDVGELVMFQSHAGTSMHVPPYVVVDRTGNSVAALNHVGLRRSGRFDAADLAEIKEVYRILYRAEAPMTQRMEEARGRIWRPAAQRFIDFVENALGQPPPRARGICPALGPARARQAARQGMRTNAQPV